MRHPTRAHKHTTLGYKYYLQSRDLVKTLDSASHNMANNEPKIEIGECQHNELYFRVKQILPQPDIELKIIRFSYPCIAIRQFMSNMENANMSNLGNMENNKGEGVGGIKK